MTFLEIWKKGFQPSATLRLFTSLPLVVWMILISLFLGLYVGMPAQALIGKFNSGWGNALGEFALILLPSFTLAAVLEARSIQAPPFLSLGVGPVAAAGMVCPDTAYAALSPVAGDRKLPLAFGSYAGFKLLLPAGPLIIATSLGVSGSWILIYSLLIFVPVWLAGTIFAFWVGGDGRDRVKEGGAPAQNLSAFLWPFALLSILVLAGIFYDFGFSPLVDFITTPKGALLVTAAISLSMVGPEQRRACVESGMRRTAQLLLIIGAASAFSAFLTAIVPMEKVFASQNGFLVAINLFLLTALLKMLQGSSMATFAAIGPLAAPVVSAAEVSPILAVIAICLGSFVAILPNDSFYWLVRKTALADNSELSAISILAGGAAVQAVTGMAVLFALHAFGLL